MARPIGTTNRPQFHTYTSEIERKEFVLWVIKNYKKSPDLAKWYGDQLFGKAMQPNEHSGPLGKPIPILNVPINVPTNNSNQENSESLKEN